MKDIYVSNDYFRVRVPQLSLRVSETDKTWHPWAAVHCDYSRMVLL